jgi:hypothetical protein
LISSFFINNVTNYIETESHIYENLDVNYLIRLIEVYHYIKRHLEDRRNYENLKELGSVTAVLLIGCLYNIDLMNIVTSFPPFNGAETMDYFLKAGNYMSNYLDYFQIKYFSPNNRVYDGNQIYSDVPSMYELFKKHYDFVFNVLNILVYGSITITHPDITKSVLDIKSTLGISYKIVEYATRMRDRIIKDYRRETQFLRLSPSIRQGKGTNTKKRIVKKNRKTRRILKKNRKTRSKRQRVPGTRRKY